LPYQLLVDHGVTHSNNGYRPPVAVRRHRIDLDHLGEDEDRCDVFGLGAELLILLRAVDTPQANLLGLPVVENSYAITVSHAADLAGPCGAGRRQAVKNCRDSPRRQSFCERLKCSSDNLSGNLRSKEHTAFSLKRFPSARPFPAFVEDVERILDAVDRLLANGGGSLEPGKVRRIPPASEYPQARITREVLTLDVSIARRYYATV
jgi:hypothetical protein